MTKTTTILAKAGLTTKGLVYVLMGILVAFTLFGRGRKADSAGVFQFIADQTFGKVLLIAIIAGLIAYALYRFYQAIMGTEDYKRDLKSLVVRAGFFFAGIMYCLLAYSAFGILTNAPSDQSTSDQVAQLLQWQYGREILYAVSACILGRAIFDAYIGWTKLHRAKVREQELNKTGQKLLTQLARIGFTSRAIVFLVISFLIFKAALSYSPAKAGGTAEAFDWLQYELGTLVLSVIGLGLVAYGSFLLFRARYPDMAI